MEQWTSLPLFKTLQNPLLESPSAALLYFSESHQWSEISFLSKAILVFGKDRSHRVPNPGCREAESPGWFNVLPKISAQDVMHKQAHCDDEAAKHQLPIAVAFWIIWTVSVEECSSLMQNMMQIHCSICSVIFNAVATQYTCSVNSVYHPLWLYTEVIIVHACAFQSTLLGCQVKMMSHKPFSLY